MRIPSTTSVLIAGGGPVGLVAATELGMRGIDCVVLEPRETVSFLRPRAKTTSVRSMELFRRWGLADRIRAVAKLPVSWSQEVVICTSLLGPEVARFENCFGLSEDKIPLFAESSQQVPQPFVEKVLREALADLPCVTFAAGWLLDSLTEFASEVRVDAVARDGSRQGITAQYVLGCDGGDSRTRESIRVGLGGSTDARSNLSLVFRAPGLARRVPHGPAVHYWVFNPRIGGVMGRYDLDETWLATTAAGTGTDPETILEDLIGNHLPTEILSIDTWHARMRLADTFQTNRVFLAGDAAHLNPPWGGHGYNTGVGDAVNIGWKLAATLHGWGGQALPHSYGPERRPVAVRTIADATRNMQAMRHIQTVAELDVAGPSGEQARYSLGQAARDTMDGEFHSLGLVLGYEYTESSVVAYDPSEAGRDWDSTAYKPSTRPGARLPHTWLPDGRSLYDTLGTGMTLLKFDQVESDAMVKAAGRRGVPLTVVDLSGVDLCPEDHAPLLLVRPDQHIAWRGKELPHESTEAILDRVLGADGG